ncbi:hypothetical protein [Moorena producens]|uniref:hypothetical protein n=1 Tax=Moorena producens TaxID=1155739 RepID=UPI00131451AE|nr:hypothetical protein [Moorena producens]
MASPLNPPILGDFESFVPPKIGGLGGQNHIHNQQRPLFPIPDSRFPIPDSH